MGIDNKNVNNSFIVPIIQKILHLFSIISAYSLISKKFWKHHELIPFWFGEAYVFGWLTIIVLLIYIIPTNASLFLFVLFLSIYRLIDILIGVSEIIFIQRQGRKDEDGHYIIARNVERWIILLFVNFIEIVVCFAVLYLFWGSDFSAEITEATIAIYQSTLTLTTLGYGEIHASTGPSHVIVIFQLFYFVYFFFLVAPMVFSAIRTKEITNEEYGETQNTVYVGMCADILHAGHIKLLEKASSLGVVTVGLLTDSAISSYKNDPTMSYNERKILVESIKGVSRVVPQYTLDYTENLELFKPSYVVHGTDWQNGVQRETRENVINTLRNWGGILEEVQYTESVSSTKLKESIRNNN